MAGIKTADQIVNTGGSPDHLQGGSTKYNRHFHEYDAATLTNRVGASLVTGDVVALSTANDSSVVLGDTVGSLQRFVVARATIADLATGEFARSGLITGVNATGTIARGQYVRKSATTKTVEDAGVAYAASVSPPSGTLGIAINAAAGGVVDVFWFDRSTSQTFLDELTGLNVSNNATDAVNDLDVAIGAAASDDAVIVNRVLLSLTAALTKQIDAVWAAGTNAGMRDSADNLTGAKTFHIYLFRRSAGGIDIFASTSITPTLPDGGDKRRRIMSVLWSGTTIRGFVQDVDLFMLKASILDVDATNPGTAAVTRTLTVPTGIKVSAIVNVIYGSPGSAQAARMYLSSLDQNDEAPSNTAAPLWNAGHDETVGIFGPANQLYVRTNTSGQIRSRGDSSNTGAILRIATSGWTDQRGRG